MRCLTWAFSLAFVSCICCGNAMAEGLQQPLSVRPAAFDYEHYLDDEVASPSDAATEAADAGADAAPAEAAPAKPVATSSSSCCTSSCCQSSCCQSSCCNPCCDWCDLGEEYSISSLLLCDNSCWNIGGWLQKGYHSESNGLFNSHPDQLNLHQAWLYVERTANPTCCNLDWGFRADVVYGTDAQDTQSFGNNPGEWDFLHGWDHGIYGWAIPQLYGEIAGQDWSVKAGHFFTLVGYEVITAPDNFFYSHSITNYLSEPFTHTGVIASYNVCDNLEVYAGWTLGWDTGFDQLGSGSSWLGGFSATVCDDVTFTYISTAGDLGWRGDDGYSHSVVIDMTLCDDLNYVIQSDMLRVDSTGEDNIGINQYLFYTVNDCLRLGTRLEWWKADNVTGYAPHNAVLPATGSFSYYEAAVGANIKPHANVTIRPEVRFDWSPGANYDETIFGVDAIMHF